MDKVGDYFDLIDELVQKSGKYKAQAYMFVSAALSYTLKKLDKPRHVTGQELLEGLKELAILHFGPMARMVLEHWGIRETIDCGEIVFQLVDAGLMGKTDEDKLEDFKDVYDFREVFDDKLRVNLDEDILSKMLKI